MKRPARIESVLLSKNDPLIASDWQSAKAVQNTGLGVMVVGLGIETAGFVKTVQGESGGNLLLIGAGTMLTGALIQIAGLGPARRAMNRYNNLQLGKVDPPIPTVLKSDSLITPKPAVQPAAMAAASDDKQPSAQITLSTGQNFSKLWEIGGSEELQSEEKIWWSHNTPLALQYEMPGRRQGHALALELAFYNKGFRIKTEETDEESSVRARSDFQLRFVQFAGLKKIPLGPPNRRLHCSAQGGVFLGYAASARLKTRVVAEDQNSKVWTRSIEKLDFGDDYEEINVKRFDAGLLLGAGASWPLWRGRIVLDARFSVGLVDLEKSESPFPDYQLPALHSRDLIVLLGYSIPVR